MGWRDTFHFDVDTYRQKTWTCSEYVLKKKHHVKVMRLYCTAAGVGTGIAAAPFTAGFTLCGATFSGRQHHILNEKRKIIEQEFINRMIPIPRYRTRDEVVGFGVGMASAGLGAVIPIGVDLITGEALNAAADASTTAAFAAVSHHVVSPQVIGHMASHAAHGIRDTVASGIRHLVGVFNGSGVAGGVIHRSRSYNSVWIGRRSCESSRSRGYPTSSKQYIAVHWKRGCSKARQTTVSHHKLTLVLHSV